MTHGIYGQTNFFTKEEEGAILQWYADNKDVIDAPLSFKNSDKKKELWKEVITKVNGLGIAKRSMADIKKKLQNMKTSVKRKIVEEKNERRRLRKIKLS